MFLFLVACTGPNSGEELGGTITAASGEAGILSAGAAFGVTSAGKGLIVVSPNASATCEDAAAYAIGGDEDFNPEVVSGEGVCTLYVLLEEYDGTELTLTDDGATLALNCAMDSGAWAYEERDGGYDGYFYSGPWWVGSPDAYTLTVSGGDGADLTLDVAMDTYYGRFPYDGSEPDEDLATGDVSGSTPVTWCPDMGPALN